MARLTQYRDRFAKQLAEYTAEFARHFRNRIAFNCGDVPGTCQVVAMVVVPVVTTHPHVLCTLDRRLFSSIVCCTLMEKVQIDEPCEKKLRN